MKRILYFVIAIMFLSAMPEIVCAQSNDPFEQHTLKARDNTTKREKKINRKKDAQNEPKEEKLQQAPEPKQAAAKELEISNACDEWLDFEFVSLVGSKGAQTVKLTGKITNHELNAKIKVGGNFISYDSEGNEHNDKNIYASSYNTVTDVPVKFTLTIPGRINPAKTKVMPVMSFDVGDCRIEMRNVPINWK